MNLLFGFSGRIGRGQWWLGQLTLFAISIVCVGVIYASEGMNGLQAANDGDLARLSGGMTALLFASTLLTAWIALAVTIKRYHDRDKSGFWILIALIPLIGPIWQLIECGFLSGSDGANSYGSRGDGGSSVGRADALDSRAYALEQPSAASAPLVPQQAGRFARQASMAFGRRGR